MWLNRTINFNSNYGGNEMKVGNRRDFLKSLSLGVGSLGLLGIQSTKTYADIEKKVKDVKNLPAKAVA